MSRLDSMIRRLMSQRASLDWAVGAVAGMAGPVLEFGLGNGRTYDHLRTYLPARDIFVFDRHVAAHPDCVPPEDRMILGDFRETAPAAAKRFAGQAALIHADVGSGDLAASRALAAELAPYWAAMLADGGLLISDQPIVRDDLLVLPHPEILPGRYFICRRVARADAHALGLQRERSSLSPCGRGDRM
jgi:hypothetical protein